MTGGMLEIPTVLGNKGGAQTLVLLAELRRYLLADQVFDWDLAERITVDFDIEHVFIFLGIVCYLRSCDGTAHVFVVFRLACVELAWVVRMHATQRTCVFQLDFDIEDCDDLSFPLTNIHISIHAQNFCDLCRRSILLSLGANELFLKILLRRYSDILVHPVPIVRVVQNHGFNDSATKQGVYGR